MRCRPRSSCCPKDHTAVCAGSPNTEKLHAARRAGHPPVVLVSPIAAPASYYDIDPDHSLVKHLLQTGRVPYVLDIGEIRREATDTSVSSTSSTTLFGSSHPRAERLLCRGPEDLETHPMARARWTWWREVSAERSACSPSPHIPPASPIGHSRGHSPGLCAGAPSPPYGSLVNQGSGCHRHSPAARRHTRATGTDRVPRHGMATRAEEASFILSNLGDTEKLARMEIVNRFQRELPGYSGGRLAELCGSASSIGVNWRPVCSTSEGVALI